MSFDSSRSGGNTNSNSKSKRSLDSSSSNPPGNGNNSNKKKKTTNQKTLGVAWGSNSRSSSRSSFRNSPFSDFGSYMVVKNQKLQDQFDVEASSTSHSGSGSVKPIFSGVSIFVDGYTIPSSQELRNYMLMYGGHFKNYFSRHSVTHIICSNLPNSKIKNLRSFSGGLPVVKPTWVLDSVAANKLLSWVPYQLDQVASENCNQAKLSAFFTLKNSPVTAACISDEAVAENEDSLLKGGTSMDANLCDERESTEHRKQYNGEPANLLHDISTGAELEEPSCSNRLHFEARNAEPSDVAKVDRTLVGNQPDPSQSRPSASVSSHCLDNQSSKESSSSTMYGPSNQRHSTLVDPNFVENYFRNSRLHFIGTWRNRYRKRFPSLSNEFKYTSSNPNDSAQETAIIHVDMDCFFVSVVIRDCPELRDKPVAVCHSDNPRGTAEISSANYPARDHGVKAGIFVRDAKALCPHLVIFPYDFEAYEEVADQLYNILHKHCKKVQAVSCDEAFLDVTESEAGDAELLASIIRKEIFETTRCTASAGIAGNMLMARLATRTAKPDGQCYIPSEKVDDYLHKLPIKALPGIGHVLEEKLKRREVKTCGQLRMISKVPFYVAFFISSPLATFSRVEELEKKLLIPPRRQAFMESLQKDFGSKTGDMLWNYSRGIDNRLVGFIQESKSIGAEVNWGVRFKDMKDSQFFLMNLCKEVALRLQGCGVHGRTFTLKVKKRRNDAGEPIKYMGCGDCENLSHSITVPMATDDANVLQRISTQLFGLFHIDVVDIRGMGLQVSKLESADNAKQGHERNSIRSWLVSASASTSEQCKAKESANTDPKRHSIDGFLDQLGTNFCVGATSASGEAFINQNPTLPPLHDLDMGVIQSLPPELFSEINDMYGGSLTSFISEKRGRNASNEGKRSLLSHRSPSTNFTANNKVYNWSCTVHHSVNHALMILWGSWQGKQYADAEVQMPPGSGAGTSGAIISCSVPENNDLMPSSLSQVDVSVLQQLPEEMKTGILGLLPAHRRPVCGSVASSDLQIAVSATSTGNQPGSRDSVSGNELWVGNPPGWVDKFKVSNCQLLRTLAETYFLSGSTGLLSSVLQRTLSDNGLPSGANTDGWDDAIYCLCELFMQYIKRKVETDIEEIYVCFRFLKRYTSNAKCENYVGRVLLLLDLSCMTCFLKGANHTLLGRFDSLGALVLDFVKSEHSTEVSN
ncbi:hypothetical protein RJ639_006983 [Escallonia herrerae]|uniref:DNA repair protein REV1 n=1 Tax=Escallonia herrerae TaxID=1293975 RepID=A0AA88VXK3_9ASTE|nr:hypothetical protein RJ639_006983 [Escallonia herrerae]